MRPSMWMYLLSFINLARALVRDAVICTPQVFTTCHPILAGDNRGCQFAPYNTGYHGLEEHLLAAGLPTSSPPSTNYWNSPVDVNTMVMPAFATSPTVMKSAEVAHALMSSPRHAKAHSDDAMGETEAKKHATSPTKSPYKPSGVHDPGGTEGVCPCASSAFLTPVGACDARACSWELVVGTQTHLRVAANRRTWKRSPRSCFLPISSTSFLFPSTRRGHRR